jgi:tetratricopeptide (TPR) repeat protein
LDPQNPYTLNNLGVADEALGEYENALKFYDAAAHSGSADAILVTDDQAWQGKSVSEMAAANVTRLQNRVAGTNSATSQADMLNKRGVLAENQNNWAAAKQDFLNAYSLDPSNAFSINNRGYVAEKDGDLESAEFFYQKAWNGDGANLRVGIATDHSAEGKPLSQLATESDQKVDGALAVYSRGRRQQSAPVELTPRDNVPPADGNAEPQQRPSPTTPPPSH